MMAAFLRLSTRERWLIGLVLPLVLVLAGWAYLWQPTQVEIAQLRGQIAETRGVQAALDLYPEGQVVQQPLTQRGPVANRVTRSAEAAGVTIARLEPLGNGLTALVDAAPFDDVLAWIVDMESAEGLRVTGVDLSRRAEPGAVSVRLDLEDAT